MRHVSFLWSWKKKQKQARHLAVEWGQLQLEQSTWAMRARIEKIATKQLLMRVPEGPQIKVITLMEPDNLADSVDKQKL
jgi:cell division protein FtsL